MNSETIEKEFSISLDYTLLDFPKEELFIDEEKQSILNRWRNYVSDKKNKNKFLFSFYGEDFFALEKISVFIAEKLGKKVMKINAEDLIEDIVNKEFIITLREIHNKKDSLVVLQIMDHTLFENEKKIRDLNYILKNIRKRTNTLFLHSKQKFPFFFDLKPFKVLELSLDRVDSKMRYKIWTHYLKDYLDNIDSETIEELSKKYQLNEGQIQAVINIADLDSLSQLENDKAILKKSIIEACHRVSQQNLSHLATELKSSYTLDDIILHEYSEGLLKQCLGFIKHKDSAYKACGLDKSPYGKGINILFTGKSGTGKTMGANVLANELGFPVYKVNLSAIVSKWLGETQKNISKIFDEAKNANVVLFFDEADALFQKRTEGEEGQEHHNNFSVGFLLQKMEEHEGICILSTNMEYHIDDAFSRRFRYIIPFVMPDVEQRKLIWEKAFVDKSILSEEVDTDYLAQVLKISGANIKNIALAGAVYAQVEKSKVTMNHLFRAVKEELDKKGELFLPSHFKGYEDLAETIFNVRIENNKTKKLYKDNIISSLEDTLIDLIKKEIPAFSNNAYGEIIKEAPLKEHYGKMNLSLFFYHSRKASEFDNGFATDGRALEELEFYYLISPVCKNEANNKYLFQSVKTFLQEKRKLLIKDLPEDLARLANESIYFSFETPEEEILNKLKEKYNGVLPNLSFFLKLSPVPMPRSDDSYLGAKAIMDKLREEEEEEKNQQIYNSTKKRNVI